MLSKLSILILAIFLVGCNREVFVYEKKEAFEDLHQSISRYSASINSRSVNWDSLGQVYEARVIENLTEVEYFELVGELLRTFRDPHIWLISPFEEMYTIDYLGYTKNYDAEVSSSYISDLEEHSSTIKSGFINDSIGYLLCLDFKGDILSQNEIYESIISKFSNTKGLIIDLRNNDGGSVYNAQNLLNKLTDQRKLWHTTQNRSLDGFDEKYDWYLESDPNVFYSNKIMVLNGRYTISAGERFAIGARILDNVTIVGDTTANTQGSVMGREMLNGWKYTLTFEKCLDPDGINYGGIGIPPDFYINSESAIINDTDHVLEKAIELLN